MPGLAGDFFLGKLLEVHRRHSRPNTGPQRTQDVVHDQSRTVHLFNFVCTAQMYRHLLVIRPLLGLVAVQRALPLEPYRALSREALSGFANNFNHARGYFFHRFEASTSRSRPSRR